MSKEAKIFGVLQRDFNLEVTLLTVRQAYLYI